MALTASNLHGRLAEELAAAKSGYLQSREVERSDGDYLASSLAEHLLEDRDFKWDEKVESAIRSLQAPEFGVAMKQFINPSKLVIVERGFRKSWKLGDLAGAVPE